MMKKVYEAPTLDIELYELDTNIAGNCTEKINNGPGSDNHEVCTKIPIELGGDDLFASRRSITGYDTNGNAIIGKTGKLYTAAVFYDDDPSYACDCYYSAGSTQYWTS